MKFFKLQPRQLLWLAILIYVAVFFSLCFYKYQNFSYTVEDLAIFNNILHNAGQGKIFWFTIHGGFNYLGDHLELGLFLLLPIYILFQSPLTLLFLQTLLFALSAWPIYLIAQHCYERNEISSLKEKERHSSLIRDESVYENKKKWLPFFISLLFLLNPFSQNIILEEFHAAPLIIFFFLWTIYFYFRKKYRLFIFFFVLTLFMREDTAMSLGAFGLIALWDHRRSWWLDKKWWLYPILISIIYFFAALKLIAFLNPDSQYRFFILYNAKDIFNPLTWLVSLFTFKNFWIIAGYLLPFLFLPLLRPKYLFLILPNFLQISLLNSGSTSVIFATHYQIFIIIALSLAAIESTVYFSTASKYKKYFGLIIFLLIIGHLYTNFYFGPLQAIKSARKNIVKTTSDLKQNQKILNLIPPQAAVSASYKFLAALSNREKIYTNRLTFLGKKHLALGDFSLPQDVEYLLIDSDDVIEYYLYFKNRKIYSPMYWSGAERMRAAIINHNFQPIYQTDSLILFKKDAPASTLPYQITDQAPADLLGTKADLKEIEFLGYQKQNSSISLWLKAKQKINDDYFLEINYLDKDQKTILQKIYFPAYGFLPTHDWPDNKILRLNQTWPDNPQIQSLKLLWIKIKGDLELGALNNVQMIIDEKEYLGPEVKIEL